jgi:hypothetical protein
MAKYYAEPEPCPICGRKPEIEQCAPWPRDMGTAPWYAGCYDPTFHGEHFRGVNGNTKSAAINKWNELAKG